MVKWGLSVTCMNRRSFDASDTWARAIDHVGHVTANQQRLTDNFIACHVCGSFRVSCHGADQV